MQINYAKKQQNNSPSSTTLNVFCVSLRLDTGLLQLKQDAEKNQSGIQSDG
jgi:hypothetical protein